MGQDASRVIVVDVEATCWESKEVQGTKPNEIIEIGICEFHVATGNILKQASIPVKPQFTEVSPFCTELTGWTQKQLDEDGMDIREAFAYIEENYKPTYLTVWGSYGNYDYQKLSSYSDKGVRMYNVTGSDNPFDRMRTHINIKTLAAMRFRLGREVGLGKMLDRLKLKFEGRPHNGGDDSFNIARVYSFSWLKMNVAFFGAYL